MVVKANKLMNGIIWLLLLPVLLVLAACATVASKPAQPSYYVMRHLDRAPGQDPGLTEEGQRKARLLVSMLAKDPPRAIYVSNTRRARETAAPVAAKLGVEPKVYDPQNTPALVAMVKTEPGTVLIVGHSNTVPDIVKQLGGARPADLAETQYGDLWHISGPQNTLVHRRIGEN